MPIDVKSARANAKKQRAFGKILVLPEEHCWDGLYWKVSKTLQYVYNQDQKVISTHYITKASVGTNCYEKRVPSLSTQGNNMSGASKQVQKGPFWGLRCRVLIILANIFMFVKTYSRLQNCDKSIFKSRKQIHHSKLQIIFLS